MAEQFDLPDPLPLKFRPFDKKLFRAIQQDVEARNAFLKFTTGRRAIDKSWLLFVLGVEAERAVPRRNFQDKWEKWHDAWEGLAGVVKSLRLLARKMRNHLKSIEGKFPPSVGGAIGPDLREAYLEAFSILNLAPARLNNIPADLEARADLIEGHVQVNRLWKGNRSGRIASTPQDAEVQAMRELLAFVKGKTGRCYYEQIAALVNVGRRLKGQKKETAETLRKFRKSPSMKRSALP